MEKVGVLPAQEYKWIDEYWAFPDSLVFTRRLKSFSFSFFQQVCLKLIASGYWVLKELKE